MPCHEGENRGPIPCDYFNGNPHEALCCYCENKWPCDAIREWERAEALEAELEHDVEATAKLEARLAEAVRLLDKYGNKGYPAVEQFLAAHREEG